MELAAAGSALQSLEGVVTLTIVPGAVLIVFIQAVASRFRERRPERLHVGTGLILAASLLALQVIGVGTTVRYLDLSALREQMGVEGGDGLMVVFLGVVVVFVVALRTGWHLLAYCAANGQWQLLRPQSEGIFRTPENRRPATLAACFGVGAALGLVSLVLFYMGGVEANPEIAELVEKVFHDVPLGPGVVMQLAMFSVAAVSEELVIRGAILAGLLRWFGESRRGIVGATVIASLLWALMHVSNTAVPAAKLAQIFIIGIIFCEFARRKGVESAVAGHLGLNIAVVLASAAGTALGLIS